MGCASKHRRYLPQEPRELDESYDNRLARSVVAPYYQRLERMLAGMLTRKPVRLEDTSDIITEQLFDVDMQGNDLNVWTYETARKLVRYGHIGTLVDAPQDGGRPYWVSYTRTRQILGWRTEAQRWSAGIYPCCGYRKRSPYLMASTARKQCSRSGC
jgi:hypothetical protein